jgi:raffinose synthase
VRRAESRLTPPPPVFCAGRRRYVDALEASATESFGANLIHCMCHSTETLYRYWHGNQIRASDDYYPRRPASHTMHVVNVAYNSLLVGEIGVPDW